MTTEEKTAAALADVVAGLAEMEARALKAWLVTDVTTEAHAVSWTLLGQIRETRLQMDMYARQAAKAVKAGEA